jgi:hypothetical protein
MNPKILRLKFDLMLAEIELEVSLREALPGWWEDLGSIFLIKLEDLFCAEREFSWIVFFEAGGGDHGCDETSSAGSYDQIKVFRQSSVFTFINSLDSQPCAPTTRSHQIPVSFLKKKSQFMTHKRRKTSPCRPAKCQC